MSVYLFQIKLPAKASDKGSQVSSFEFCKIFKNTVFLQNTVFSQKHLRWRLLKSCRDFSSSTLQCISIRYKKILWPKILQQLQERICDSVKCLRTNFFTKLLTNFAVTLQHSCQTGSEVRLWIAVIQLNQFNSLSSKYKFFSRNLKKFHFCKVLLLLAKHSLAHSNVWHCLLPDWGFIRIRRYWHSAALENTFWRI